MIANGDFTAWQNEHPVSWTLKVQRPALAPTLAMVAAVQDGGKRAVLGAIGSALSMGMLTQRVEVPQTLVQSETPWLRFDCRVTLDGDQHIPQNARIVLTWEKAPGKGKGWRPPRQFFVPIEPIKGHTGQYTAQLLFPVIPGGGALTVQLAQYGGKKGTVAYSNVHLTPVPSPPPRKVKIATAYYMPKGRGDWARNLEGIAKLTAQAAQQGCDLILFGEGLSVVGSGKSYYDVAESIPGRCSDDLAALARKHRIFLCGGLYERDGDAAYNTAVLFDRTGKQVGKYRKVHLPWPEWVNGLQPGDEFPVFHTELGAIGIQICYDHHFAESARCLALNGAEIILTPIWGDLRGDGACYDAVAQTRALDNGVFYVMSVYSLARSLIADPYGRILAKTSGPEPELAIAEVDLNQCLAVQQPCRIPPNIQMNQPHERRPSAYRALMDAQP